MALISANSMGGDIYFVVIDHDPRTTSTDIPGGSLVMYIDEVTPFAKPLLFYKLVDGDNTLVEKVINRNNYTATTAPGVTDDWTYGFDTGSEWYDTVSTTLYKCVNSAAGAAVWIAI